MEYFLPSRKCKRGKLELPMASQFKMFLSHSVVSNPIQTLLFNRNTLFDDSWVPEWWCRTAVRVGLGADGQKGGWFLSAGVCSTTWQQMNGTVRKQRD